MPEPWRRALLVVLVPACTPASTHTPPPVEAPPAAAVDQASPERALTVRAPSGRLRTGRGLCRVHEWRLNVRLHDVLIEADEEDGEEEDEEDINYINLWLSYDEAGRVVKSTTEIDPIHCREPTQFREVTWAWDELNRLKRVEEVVKMEESLVAEDSEGEDVEGVNEEMMDAFDAAAARKSMCPRDADTVCLLHGKPILTRSHEFRWTSDGRLAGWAGTNTNCERTSSQEESLRWSEGMVEVTGTGPQGPYVDRYRIDSRGHIIETNGVVQYRYDAQGRLVEEKRKNRDIVRWWYDAPAVGSSEDQRPWSQIEMPGKIILRHESQRRNHQVEIRFDDRRRPVEVTEDDTRWTFEYDDCENADRASAQWWLDSLLDAWPWAEVPTAGSGQKALERWTNGYLPLYSW